MTGNAGLAWVRSLAALALAGLAGSAAASCIECHPAELPAPGDPHAAIGAGCQVCHGGDAGTRVFDEAHRGVDAFPGRMDNAGARCGNCHPDQVRSVAENLMQTGRGMVHITRFALGEHPAPGGPGDLSQLGDSPADSMLRKLCASCHLGQPKQAHKLDPVRDRGGGCLACHVNAYPDPGHPTLTSRVEDGRCFGCHSRSGRISLNYAGLAEIDAEALQRPETVQPGRLPDGRLVERRPPDLHHRAGMACIDCHTGVGLMGSGKGLDYAAQAVDIQCGDCHRPAFGADPGNPPAPPGRDGPGPRPGSGGQGFPLTARHQTPLRHIRADGDGTWLYPRLGGPRLRIPEYTKASHPPGPEHARLTCQACHSGWAPQCYGCHVEYDPGSLQWDHLARRGTPGAWHETRSLVRNGAPPLGVDDEERIRPHVPGMIMQVEHPDFPEPLFRRLFAPLDPHTSGKARTCRDCHLDSKALGLGDGELRQREDGRWSFRPTHPTAADGLPADAWTDLNADRPGVGTHTGHRSFNRQELARILGAAKHFRDGTTSGR